jgi:hypothetical protein
MDVLFKYATRAKRSNIVTNMSFTGQRFGKHVPAATNKRSNKRTVGGSDLSSVRPESQKSHSFEREFNHSAVVRVQCSAVEC